MPDSPTRERWRPVADAAGYEVSDLGRVRSRRRRGPGGGLADEAVPLDPQLDGGGYPAVDIPYPAGVRRVAVHRLVLEAFAGRAAGRRARRRSTDRTDNRLTNLFWSGGGAGPAAETDGPAVRSPGRPGGRPRKEYLGRSKVHNGRSRVWWNGGWNDLGPAGSKEAKAEYARLAARIAAGTDAEPVLDRDEYLVATLCREYLAADAPTPGRRYQVGQAVGLLLEHHLATAVDDFGPVALAAWQKWLCQLTHEAGKKAGERRFNRTYVMMLVTMVRRIWKWGVANEKVGQVKYAALLAVEAPRKGEAKPARKVRPAPAADVSKVLPLLLPPVRAVVDLMALTGGRPSEICLMRPRDVFRSGVVELPVTGPVDLDNDPDAKGLWVYVPDSHKTDYLDKPRWLPLGPADQRVLAPWLDRDPDSFCFSPAEAVAAKVDAAAAARKTPRWPSHLANNERRRAAEPKRQPGRRYTANALNHAVKRACERAGVAPLSPYQLRHAALSAIDLKYGLDAAQHVGGHTSPQTTRRYAQRSFAAAARVAQDRT